jgi:sugar lactone lactonase YvrE
MVALPLFRQTLAILSSRLPSRLLSRSIQSLIILQPWLDTRCSLGEGPFWEEETNTIRFLDIEKQKLMRVDLNKGPSSLKTVKEHDISMG